MRDDPTAAHTARFAALVARPARDVPLDEAAACLAAHAHPALDVDAVLDRLDGLARLVPAPTVDGVRRLLFDDLGFAGNRDDYYDPRNSLLDEVLERRLGIPITLSLLTIEVARRVFVGLVGVGMPGHFLVRDAADETAFVDPFNGGRRLDADGCAALYRAAQGPGAAFDGRWLQPVGATEILVRMLTNLRAIYAQRRDQPALVWVTRLRAAMPGATAAAWREHATVLAATGRLLDAAQAYERAADLAGPRGDADAVMATRLRARLN